MAKVKPKQMPSLKTICKQLPEWPSNRLSDEDISTIEKLDVKKMFEKYSELSKDDAALAAKQVLKIFKIEFNKGHIKTLYVDKDGSVGSAGIRPEIPATIENFVLKEIVTLSIDIFQNDVFQKNLYSQFDLKNATGDVVDTTTQVMSYKRAIQRRNKAKYIQLMSLVKIFKEFVASQGGGRNGSPSELVHKLRISMGYKVKKNDVVTFLDQLIKGAGVFGGFKIDYKKDKNGNCERGVYHITNLATGKGSYLKQSSLHSICSQVNKKYS